MALGQIIPKGTTLGSFLAQHMTGFQKKFLKVLL